MRVLFLHQNFPGQFKFLAGLLAHQGHEVVAMGVNIPPSHIQDIKFVRHTPSPLTNTGNDNAGLSDLHAKLSRGLSAIRKLCELRSSGFTPDLIYAHPGWGEALHVKSVFPSAKLIVFAEFFYGQASGDLGFDPEFPPAITDEPVELARINLKNLALSQALCDADLAVSPTHFQKQQHPRWAQSKIHVIHDGIHTKRFQPNPQASIQLQRSGLALCPGDEVVTYVARHLEPYRGFHQFMRALPLLQSLRPNCHVVLVGGEGVSYGSAAPAGSTWKSIYLKEVQSGLDMKRIHFVGMLPHHVLTQLMQVSAAHVYLTYPFVLSWSLMEAMSCGCTVIGSDTAPVREVITHGQTGLLVDFFDHAALATTIADTLANRQDLRHLGQNARALVQDQYDLERVCLPRQIALMNQSMAM